MMKNMMDDELEGGMNWGNALFFMSYYNKLSYACVREVFS